MVIAVSSERELYNIAQDPTKPPTHYKHTSTDMENWNNIVHQCTEKFDLPLIVI